MAVFRYRRVGGLRFLRLGRWQFSFCVVRKGAGNPTSVAYRFTR